MSGLSITENPPSDIKKSCSSNAQCFSFLVQQILIDQPHVSYFHIRHAIAYRRSTSWPTHSARLLAFVSSFRFIPCNHPYYNTNTHKNLVGYMHAVNTRSTPKDTILITSKQTGRLTLQTASRHAWFCQPNDAFQGESHSEVQQ